jgi:hypothetical protein
MIDSATTGLSFPRPLTEYVQTPGETLTAVLSNRLQLEPFNGIATAIFLLAIVHTFMAGRFTRLAHRLQHAADQRGGGEAPSQRPSVAAEMVHFLGEIEVVFGLWAVVLLMAITAYAGWDIATDYVSVSVDYTEAVFVVVVMALASTRPIVRLAESSLRRVANLGGATPTAWWTTILIVGPLLGSLITEPAAMTICALLLGRQFYDLRPTRRLKYATLGLLFVNVSIGGTLTHFAAPPVLMVARPWMWDAWFMLTHIGWRSVIAIVVSTLVYRGLLRGDLRDLSGRVPVQDIERPDEDAPSSALPPVPPWVTVVHVVFLAWIVMNAHHRVLFVGGFLFFLGFARATAVYQSEMELRTPLLVGFFLAGLVIHGGLQGWWIAPVLGSLSGSALFVGSVFLTAFNDNALITYLATLVPNLDEQLKIAVVSGAVAGGGLTVIANAPNPAGQALLNRFFDGVISPIGLACAALIPTLIAALMFRVF